MKLMENKKLKLMEEWIKIEINGISLALILVESPVLNIDKYERA